MPPPPPSPIYVNAAAAVLRAAGQAAEDTAGRSRSRSPLSHGSVSPELVVVNHPKHECRSCRYVAEHLHEMARGLKRLAKDINEETLEVSDHNALCKGHQ